jgi:hypothetical protein
VKMIQLSALNLLLLAGLYGSAWAQAPAPQPSPPAVQSAEPTPSGDTAQSSQAKQADQQARTYYVWDRVGKPLGKESFLI